MTFEALPRDASSAGLEIASGHIPRLARDVARCLPSEASVASRHGADFVACDEWRAEAVVACLISLVVFLTGEVFLG